MTPEPPDSADLDALQELQQAPGYVLTMERIFQTIETKRDDLERFGAQTDFLRGQLSGLRLALAIPAILRDEIKNSIKE